MNASAPATCPLRPRVCPAPPRPATILFDDYSVRKDEDDDAYWTRLERVTFCKHGFGHLVPRLLPYDPHERDRIFPYRCLRSRPETEKETPP